MGQIRARSVPAQRCGLALVAYGAMFLTACGSPGKPESPTLQWQVYDRANSELPHDWVRRVAVGPDGTVWIGTFESGLAALRDGTWSLFTAATSALPDDTVHDIAVEGNGAVWVATGQGLARFDGMGWEVYDRSNAPFAVDHVWAVAVDGSGTVWVGSGRVDAGGLYAFRQGVWTAYTPLNSSLPCSIVETIYSGPGNVTWVGTSQCQGAGGIARIDGGVWTVFTKANAGLRYNAVESLTADPNGNVWAGSDGKFYLEPGVLHGSLARFDGTRWVEHRPAESGRMSNRVRAVVADGHGRLFVATSVEQPYGPQMAVLDGNTWTVLSDMDPAFPNPETVFDLAVDADNRIWAATDAGVFVLELAPG